MAVKTRSALNAEAIVIRDETVTNANTAARVGGHMENCSDSYAMSSDITGFLSATDIDTLAEINAIITDATLIDTADARLSDARTPTAHTHTASEVTDFDTEVSNNASVTANTAKVSWAKNEEIMISCSDLTTALTTGTTKAYIRMPFAMTLTSVRASVLTAPTGAALQVDINESGATILSTKLTIDISEKTSTTAATPPVISDASLADDAEITIDIDTVGSSTAGAGLIITLIGTRT